MTPIEKSAQLWHDGSDHARDGEPFGGPLCNCMSVAERLRPLLANAYDTGWYAAVGSAPGDVWFTAWNDDDNPYRETP